MIYFYTYSFILGLVLGSFYNVVGLRIPKKESLLNPPSHCPHCGRRLTLIDLIPIMSYLLLRGRCRTCQKPISILYPAMELSTGILFVFITVKSGTVPDMIIGWALTSLLIIILVSDLTYLIIPDKILAVFLIFFIALRIWQPLSPWWSSLLGGIIGFFLLYLIALIRRGGMGGADIKLFGVLGILLGWKLVLFAFFLSTAYGTLLGGIALLLGWLKKSKPIPFGPYIALGTLTAYFFGKQIIQWYMHLI